MKFRRPRNLNSRCRSIRCVALIAVALLGCELPATHGAATSPPAADLDRFLKRNCYECHRGTKAEAGFDLTKLPRDLTAPNNLKHWVRTFDRVATGEMPPPEDADLDTQEKTDFLKSTGVWLRDTEVERYKKHGRVQARRLTNLQLERSLHDLLGIDIPLADQFPDEQPAHRYSTVADGQPMSRYQLERHMGVVDMALDEAFRRTISKPDEFSKTFDGRGLSRRNPRRRCREPELIDGHGVIWSSGMIFYGRVPVTTARERGWYRITLDAKALNSPANYGVWCKVQTGPAVSSAPLMNWVGSFEATQELDRRTFEGWLEKGDMFEIRPGDTTLKKGRFAGGQVGTGEGGPQKVPGVAMKRLVWERFHKGATNEQIRSTMIDDLQINPHRDWRQAGLKSKTPQKDLRRLIERFAERAFRRPVPSKVVEPYVELAQASLKNGESLIEALRVGYRTILCSPRFLYFYEQAGALDDHAVATRLSYLLWNRPPDNELLKLATAGKLRSSSVLKSQLQRMLKDPRGKQFVKDFADEWLDLRLIDFTTPDPRLYRTFDTTVKHSMLDETHAFLQAMLDDNLSVSHLVDSEFTFLNSRLSRFYEDIDDVKGGELRRVKLPATSQRGGLLGQGAILKVTANGTNTSPILRGVWLSERILGLEIPPPPPNIPAIDPDIRGAKTIRDQLAKHRSIESCAACHKVIDPPGFALENFDPAGSWRDRYGRKGAKIDASYTFADGREFDDLNGYRALIIANPKRLAHNVAEQLLTYGTGAMIGFSDRDEVDRIVKSTAATKFGFASIVEAVVTSPIFLNK